MTLLGRQIGRYKILEQLGSGGMSVVYKGLDTALDREVAVKVLHPHLARKEESRKRLAREAKAVAKLHHPNILEVFDFAGADSEDAYIVTEYIRGQTLREYANAITLDPPELAAMVIHEIASALAHAHDSGIIHRDLKPENVMVRTDGVLKLMDFGIAKIIDRDDKMTMTGALVGSPAHMAPEIIEGEEVGPEADVFSLGTMLYFLATTRLPFTGTNTTATLKKILDCVYDDPRQLVPTVSDDLAEIIATCLSRQPQSRYANAGKLRDALAGYLGGLGFTRVGEELHSFFADPPSYRKLATARICESLVKRGEALIAEKRPAKALSALNQVLALDPHNARALELLQQMNQTRKRERGRRTSLYAAAGAFAFALLAAGGVKAWEVANRSPDFTPSPLRANDLVLAAALFPTPTVKAVEPPKEELKAVEPPKDDAQLKKTNGEIAKTKAVFDKKVAVKMNTGDEGPPRPTVDVKIHIKPYGAIAVGDGPFTPLENSVHALKLPLGQHKVRISCQQRCEENSKTITVTDTEREFRLPARAAAAFLTVDYQPRDAVVRINNGPEVTVADTMANPVRVVGPEGRFDNDISVEVSRKGYQTEKKTVPRVLPGARVSVQGSLKPE